MTAPQTADAPTPAIEPGPCEPVATGLVALSRSEAQLIAIVRKIRRRGKPGNIVVAVDGRGITVWPCGPGERTNN